MNSTTAQSHKAVFLSAFSTMYDVDQAYLELDISSGHRRLINFDNALNLDLSSPNHRVLQEDTRSVILSFTITMPVDSTASLSNSIASTNATSVDEALATAAREHGVSLLFADIFTASISEPLMVFESPLPTEAPTTAPPSGCPTSSPSATPTAFPSLVPTAAPTTIPTTFPTSIPTTTAPTAATCKDDKQNGAETDIDCGGPDCPVCETGYLCSEDSDCKSRICLANLCVAQPTTCPTSVPTSVPTRTPCDMLEEPITPVLSSVAFSSTGAQLTVTFDSETDRGSMSGGTSFTCDVAVDFIGASDASCLWLSAKEIVITLDSSATVVPGDTLTINDDYIRASCPYYDCSCWNATSGSISIDAPSSPVSVVASVESPSSIGLCSDLELSAEASSGGGGRDLEFRWNFTGDGSENCTSANLNAATDLTQAELIIANALIRQCSGSTISVLTTVSNFFGVSSSVTKEIQVLPRPAPNIEFVGESVVNTLSSRKVQFRAQATSVACDADESSAGSFTFKYHVLLKERNSSTYVEGPSSTRSDPRLYELDPYTLSAGDMLLVKVTVWEKGVNNSAIATLIVDTSDLVPIIEGGDRTVTTLSSLILDGQRSYDPDDLGLLEYKWSCINASLDLTSETNSILSFGPGELDAGTYEFELFIISTADGRNASTFVTIDVSASEYIPVVSIASLEVTKANPSAKLTVNGYIDRGQVELASTWSMEGVLTDGLTLDETARTSLTRTMAVGNDTAIFYLVLPANSLIAGASYKFTLAADAIVSIGQASISILANKPPIPGIVTSDPTSGTVLVTSFSLMGSYWSDDAEDLPMVYEFGYIASTGSTTILRESTPSPEYENILLPAGTGENETLIVSLRVYDQLASSDVAYTTVIVSVESELSSDALANTTDTLIDNAVATADTEAVFQVANAVASLLDASSAIQCNPNCTSLGRSTCDEDETDCGDCIFPLIGDDGPSNEQCIEEVGNCTDGIQGESETDVDCGGECPLSCSIGKSCLVASDCTSKRCMRGLCALAIKKCTGGCGQGSCKHYDTEGELMASANCDVENEWCTAKCVCPSGRYGSNCEYDKADWEAQQTLRASVLNALLQTSEGMDGTQEAANQQAAACSSITSNVETLTPTAVDSSIKILSIALNTSSESGFGEDDTEDLLVNAISNIMKSGLAKDKDTAALLDQVATAGLKDVVAGEEASNTCADSFCMTSSRTSAEDFATTQISSLSSDGSEDVGPGVQMSIDADENDLPDTIDLSLVEFADGRNNVTRQSSVARINVASNNGDRRRLSSDATISSLTLFVTLTNYYAISYTEANVSDIGTIDCSGKNELINTTCANNETAIYNCSKSNGLVNPCSVSAVCQLWIESSSSWDTDACSVLNYTETNTTCVCVRELVSGDENIDSIEITSSSELVAKEFADVFHRNPLHDLAQTATVLAVFFGIALLSALAASWGMKQDHRDKKEIVEFSNDAVGATDSKRSIKKIKAGAIASEIIDSDDIINDRATVRERAIEVLNKSLPAWVRDQSSTQTYIRRMFEQHPLVNYLVFDPIKSRPLRAMQIYVEYCWILAGEAVLFLLCFPDLGCDDYEIEDDCLKPNSPYFPNVPACTWDEDIDPNCTMNATKGAQMSTYVILLLIISAILIPLGMFINLLFNVIATPLLEEDDESKEKEEAKEKDKINNTQKENQIDEVEAACRRDLPFDDRVNTLYEATILALRSRHAELKEAITHKNDEAAKQSIDIFERRYGLRRKHMITWRLLFFNRETDEERFKRKVRRRVIKNLKRADAYDDELQNYSREKDKSQKISEFARLERLTLLEQRIYLRNKLSEEVFESGNETSGISKRGKYLAIFLIAIFTLFPIYFTLVVFADLSSRSKSLANGWLISVSLYVFFDTFFYTPMRIWFFYSYLPSLIKLKLRALGDPTTSYDDLPFEFSTPLFDGSVDYLVARHNKKVTMASILLAGHFRRKAEELALRLEVHQKNVSNKSSILQKFRRLSSTLVSSKEVIPNEAQMIEKRKQSTFAQQLNQTKESFMRRRSTAWNATINKVQEWRDPEVKRQKDIQKYNPDYLRKHTITLLRLTTWIWVWAFLLILPEALQDLIASELIVFGTTTIFYAMAGVLAPVALSIAHIFQNLNTIVLYCLILSPIALAIFISFSKKARSLCNQYLRRKHGSAVQPEEIDIEDLPVKPKWLAEGTKAAEYIAPPSEYDATTIDDDRRREGAPQVERLRSRLWQHAKGGIFTDLPESNRNLVSAIDASEIIDEQKNPLAVKNNIIVNDEEEESSLATGENQIIDSSDEEKEQSPLRKKLPGLTIDTEGTPNLKDILTSPTPCRPALPAIDRTLESTKLQSISSPENHTPTVASYFASSMRQRAAKITTNIYNMPSLRDADIGVAKIAPLSSPINASSSPTEAQADYSIQQDKKEEDASVMAPVHDFIHDIISAESTPVTLASMHSSQNTTVDDFSNLGGPISSFSAQDTSSFATPPENNSEDKNVESSIHEDAEDDIETISSAFS